MKTEISLSGPFLPAKSGQIRHLVVLLHGLGADGNDLFGLAPELADSLPDAAFISPNAPFPCDMAPYGYQWFSLLNWSEASMLKGVQNAAPILNAFIDEQLEKHKLKPSSLAIIGFSQGTMTALHTLLRRPEPIAGIVGFSGALISPPLLASEIQNKTPVCLIHGNADPIVPFAALAQAETALKAAGVPVEAHARPGLPHGIDGPGLDIARRFLQEQLS
jgi:phospholipase/carboxylesterase